MKLNRLIVLCFAVLFFYGCRKGENAKEIIPPPTPGPGVTEIGLSGDIKNPDGSPAEGVEVTIDGHKTITSASGLFEYTGKVSNADKVKLSISKNGYFKCILAVSWKTIKLKVIQFVISHINLKAYEIQ
ncbi:hypothetical protein ACEN9X_02365 [Mucilaginibacter sp. Mucisp86]|uniref:hypothetical protein n=1 Tax=Mucilaginibacter sp. Mucisp86 TaxID=3243060 RepID=UPI0039B3CB41